MTTTNKRIINIRRASVSTTALMLVSLLPAALASAQKPAATTASAKVTCPNGTMNGKAPHLAAKTRATSLVGKSTFVTLSIKGMVCEGCAMLVKQDLMDVAGVASAEVSVPNQTAIVGLSSKKATSNDALKAAVKKAGYAVTAIAPTKVSDARKSEKNHG